MRFNNEWSKRRYRESKTMGGSRKVSEIVADDEENETKWMGQYMLRRIVNDRIGKVEMF